MNPLVSIVTVSFNSEKTIARTLESVLLQTYGNIEYIIIDGASKDNTVKLAESYSERFAASAARYRIVSEPDNGIYDAMNKGVAMACGEIVGIINSDDWYEPDAVEKAVYAYAKYSYDLMFAALRVHTGNAAIIKKPKNNRFFVSSRHWNHPTMFVAKKLYLQERYACEDIYDDFDFYLRMRRRNKKIVIIDDILANFSFGGISNKKNIAKAWKRVMVRYRVYRKNKYSRIYFFECLLMELAKLIMA